MNKLGYFAGLNYSMGEEDASIEYALLSPGVETVLAVAGGGTRIVPLLSRRPRRVVCVDVSAEQLALTALRIELVRVATHAEFLSFMGYRDGMGPKRRRELFDRLPLAPPQRQAAQHLLEGLGWNSPLYAGRFEKMLRSLWRVNALVTGERARKIFDFHDVDAQKGYYETAFPHRRWNFVVSLLGNAAVLNRLLYKGAFPQNNTGLPTRLIYKRIFHALFTTQVARRSFLLQMLFFGRLVFEEGFPLECRHDVFSAAKEALAQTSLEYRNESVLERAQAERGIGFVSLSDVPSFLNDHEAQAILAVTRPALAPGAMVVMRSHLRIVRPDQHGYTDISQQHRDLLQSESTGLWTFGVFRAD